MKVFLHSRVGLGARQVLADFANGKAHNPRPYGFEAAETLGVQMDYSEDAGAESAALKLRLRELSWKYLGFDVVHAWDNRKAMREADAVWTVLEWEWLPVSLLQKLRILPKRPIVGNSVWLMNYWSKSGRRSHLYHWLMTPCVHLALHSQAAHKKALQEIPDKTFHVVPFGISTRAFPVLEPKVWTALDRPLRIYSIGNDRTRDWKTMLAAFGNDQRFEVRIICGWIGEVVDPKAYDNLTVPKGEVLADQLAAYAWADVVIMPMTENVYSGITVVCEAVAQGVPVVSSRTGGVPTYFGPDEVLYVAPGDPDALREAVLSRAPEAWKRQADAATARFRNSDYSEFGMAKRYIECTEGMLAKACVSSKASKAPPRLNAELTS
jgi:glycosyltransferase involved in cell wall biosynthesis